MEVVRGKGASKVNSVRLEVGDLTFLEWDQLRFAWEIYTRNVGPPLEGAELTLERITARGTCPSCGYSGDLKVVDFPDSHFSTPSLDCPDCDELVNVTEGRDLLIRDISMEVPEGHATGDEDDG
jgi:hydrogenase nickel incorporation protein HypA/HybF